MSADNSISKQHYRNDNVITHYTSRYLCSATPPYSQSISFAAELKSCSYIDRQSQSVEYLKCPRRETLRFVGMYDKYSAQSFYRVWHVQFTITVTLIAIALSRALVRFDVNDTKNFQFKIWLRYILEFVVISVPIISGVNVANAYVELIVIIAFLIVLSIMCCTKCWQQAAKREYQFGRRPTIFTLMRSSINILTAVCILAIDFKSFPKEFRKSRRYGVGLMDVGIGVFVFSMGLVSTRPSKCSDFRKLIFTVSCLLTLGVTRTLVISAIDYHQDQHEYGTHLNAFFTLGFTKLFGTGFSFLAQSNSLLLALGLVILLSHEAFLQCGAWKYVMDPDIERVDFISSNREGLCSLPGFVALYLLSQYLGKWLHAKEKLNFEEIKSKLKALSLTSFILWLSVILAIFIIGIARVTCNLGYVLWILAIAVTIFTFYLLIFDIVLDTLIPINNTTKTVYLLDMPTSNQSSSNLKPKLPLLVEAVNFNGLTFFLLANILTGCTNIYFATDEKTNLESVFILFIYMFITTTFVFVLYRLKIRIV